MDGPQASYKEIMPFISGERSNQISGIPQDTNCLQFHVTILENRTTIVKAMMSSHDVMQDVNICVRNHTC